MQRNYSYSYFELMDDRQRRIPEFNCYDLGEDMLLFTHRKKGIGFTYLVNTESEECFELMDKHGNLTSFTLDDIDLKTIDDLPFTDSVINLKCGYGIFLDDFHNGTALFRWTYFIDESHYHALDDSNNYKRLYGFINKHCQVIVPFQPMSEQHLQQMKKRQLTGFQLDK